MAEKKPGALLLAFCTPVIIAKRHLGALAGPAYNFHPGPPEISGRFPSVWAIWEEATHFGVTAHEVAEKVDSGLIIDVEYFVMDDTIDRLNLDALTHDRVLALFNKLPPELLASDIPLQRIK